MITSLNLFEKVPKAGHFANRTWQRRVSFSLMGNTWLIFSRPWSTLKTGHFADKMPQQRVSFSSMGNTWVIFEPTHNLFAKTPKTLDILRTECEVIYDPTLSLNCDSHFVTPQSKYTALEDLFQRIVSNEFFLYSKVFWNNLFQLVY